MVDNQRPVYEQQYKSWTVRSAGTDCGVQQKQIKYLRMVRPEIMLPAERRYTKNVDRYRARWTRPTSAECETARETILASGGELANRLLFTILCLQWHVNAGIYMCFSTTAYITTTKYVRTTTLNWLVDGWIEQTTRPYHNFYITFIYLIRRKIFSPENHYRNWRTYNNIKSTFLIQTLLFVFH